MFEWIANTEEKGVLYNWKGNLGQTFTICLLVQCFSIEG